MLVELVGLPTSGKTSLLQPLIDALKAHGHRVQKVSDLAKLGEEKEREKTPFIRRHIERTSLYGAINFGYENPILFEQLCGLRRDPRHTSRNLQFLSECYFARPLMAELGFHLADEGLVHRGIISCAIEKDEEALKTYISALPRPMICVYLDIPVWLAVRRSVEARGTMPYRKMAEGKKPKKLLKDAYWMTRLAMEACTAQGIPVVHLDARASTEDIALQLADALPKAAAKLLRATGKPDPIAA